MKARSIAPVLLALALGIPSLSAATDSAANFKIRCAPCHGADGSGNTPMGKSLKVRDLRGADVQKQTDVELTKVISGGKGKMPAYGKQLSTADIAAVIGYVRTLKAK